MYKNTINKELKGYFKILCKDYDYWMDYLEDYINTPVMQYLKNVDVSCGKKYSKMFEIGEINTLDHSIGVALIIANFTNDKKQVLSGLYHDVASRPFKHTIDFLFGDWMKQEQTEDETKNIIMNDKATMDLLKRDNITVDEICDYHIYPIADNDTPKLSSDRLEYTLANGCFAFNMVSLDDVKAMYNDLVVLKNEDGIDELGFKTKSYAEKFVLLSKNTTISYRDPKTRYTMQFLADVLKIMRDNGYIKIENLIGITEDELVGMIKNCSLVNEDFEKWQNATDVHLSNEEPKGVYYVHHGSKVRWVNPLCNSKRIYDISYYARKCIKENLNYKMDEYVYLDFDLFKDAEKKLVK